MDLKIKHPVGPTFLGLVERIKEQLNLGEEHRVGRVQVEVPDHFNQEEKPAENRVDEMISTAWNSFAGQWVAVESPANYFATMQTLVEKVRSLQPATNKKVQILSLGSGPGLYETYLAWLLRESKVSARICSTDYAPAMIDFQQSLLSGLLNVRLGGKPLSVLSDILQPEVADMTALPKKFTGVFDIVICNNSLQWVADWKKAVAEIAKAIKPTAQNRRVFFIIHPHPMRMMAGPHNLMRDHVSLEALLDECELCNLEPQSMRHMMGPPGSGQAGSQLNRMLVEVQLAPQGISRSWRAKSATLTHPRVIQARM